MYEGADTHEDNVSTVLPNPLFERDGIAVFRAALVPAWLDVLRKACDAGFSARSFLWRYGPEFVRLSCASGLADIAARMLGGPVILLYDEFLEKRPGDRFATPWHVDISYWPIEGSACSIWLALDSVTEENGGMEYVLGSQAWGRSFKPASVRDRDAWRDAPGEDVPDVNTAREAYPLFSCTLEPGDAVVHDARTLHAAHSNLSARPRRAYITRWLKAGAVHVPKPHAKVLPPELRAFENYPLYTSFCA